MKMVLKSFDIIIEPYYEEVTNPIEEETECVCETDYHELISLFGKTECECECHE